MAAASYLFSTLSRPSLAAGLFSQREKDGLNWQLRIAFLAELGGNWHLPAVKFLNLIIDL